MISLFRKFMKSWVFGGLVGLLVLSFAIYGMSDVLSGASGDSVVQAGDRQISSRQYRSQFDSWREDTIRQSGQNVTAEDFVREGMHIQLMNQMADNTVLVAWLEKAGIRASKQAVANQVAQIPAFRNSVTQQFDRATYTQVLAQNNTTPQELEREFGDQIALQHFATAANAGFRAPRIAVALQSSYALQKRDANLIVFTPQSVAEPAKPTDEEVKAYYDANKESFRTPELRQAHIIRFVPGSVGGEDVTIDEAELRKMYDFQLDALSTPETRTFVSVTTGDQASATAIATAIRGGQSPQDAAKAHNGQVTSYADRPATAVSDDAVREAAFKLEKGQVSDAIAGRLGFAVVRVDDIKAGSQPSYAQVRPQLLEAYKAEKQSNAIHEAAVAFSDAHNKGEAFEDIAKRLGLRVDILPAMDAEGRTADPRINLSSMPQIVTTVFGLPEGGESDVEELGGGASYAVRVVKVTPAAYTPFEEVKPYLAEQLHQQKWSAAVAARAEEAKAKLEAGESAATVAKTFGGTVESVKGIDRQTGPQQLGPQLTNQVFMTAQGRIFTANGQGGTVALGQVEAVHHPDPEAANMFATNVSSQIGSSLALDVNNSVRSGAKAAVKLKTNPALAIRALGVDPQQIRAEQTNSQSSGN